MSYITEYEGDLLHSPCNIIMHQTNCQKTMGAGIAKQIKQMYPEAYRADYRFMMGLPPGSKLGNFSWAQCEDGRFVVNLYGQLRYGRDVRQTDYRALESALRQAFGWIKNNFASPTIGLPKGMGCNNAGGDWETVYEIIDTVSKMYQIPVHIYQYK